MLERPSIPCEGAVELLKKLHREYVICIATNAVSSIQRPRLVTLAEWIDHVYISEEVGFVKPMPQFFARILEDLGVTADECLMVGDSLSSDVAGANNSGIDSCWLNRKGRVSKNGVEPTYEIHSLAELTAILEKN